MPSKPKRLQSQWERRLDDLREKSIGAFCSNTKKHWSSYIKNIEDLGGSVCISDDSEIEIMVPEDAIALYKFLLTCEVRHKMACFYAKEKYLVLSF